MALYEMRTYSLCVGKMGDAVKLYKELGWPALEKGGHDEKLVGYFTCDVANPSQLVLSESRSASLLRCWTTQKRFRSGSSNTT